MHDWMLLVTGHVGLQEHIPVSGITDTCWRIYFQKSRHLVIKKISFMSVRQRNRLLIQAIILWNSGAAVVALSGMWAIEQLHEIAAVWIIRNPRTRPHHQPTLFFGF